MHIHFLGIGGSGASAAAAIAKAQGYKISGCDLNPHNEFTTKFDRSELEISHSPKHLDGVDVLAVTPAIFSQDPNNDELKEAEKKGIEVMTWEEFMGRYLEKDKFVIAIAGTHGKSTTTAMIGQLLEDAGLDPTVELGAVVKKWGGNYRIGKSKYFVTEADEHGDSYLATQPDICVVTNIEMDHPEYFKDLEAVKESFHRFLSQTKESIVANITDLNVAEILKQLMKEKDIKSIDYTKQEVSLKLKLIGEYNLQNAKAVFTVGLLLGIEPKIIKNSLENFEGISKRFEKLGELNGAQIYTDFAHHPTEIEVTTKAIREKFPDKRIWIIFQPHMYSRTKYLFDDFVRVFKNLPVDGIWIVDIFASREKDSNIVSSEKLVKAINLPQKVEYMEDWQKIEDSIKSFVGKDDVVVFMGAGIVDQIGKRLVK